MENKLYRKIVMKNFILLIILFTGFISFSCLPEQNDLKASLARGKKVYDKTCITCHQPDGDGVPRMNPPLIKTHQVLGSKEKLVRIIVQGYNEQVEINGEIYYTPMPAQPLLSNQEIADVLTYIRNNFGNKASAVTVSEVNKIRAKIK